jgi:hypothetical protein
MPTSLHREIIMTIYPLIEVTCEEYGDQPVKIREEDFDPTRHTLVEPATEQDSSLASSDASTVGAQTNEPDSSSAASTNPPVTDDKAQPEGTQGAGTGTSQTRQRRTRAGQ